MFDSLLKIGASFDWITPMWSFLVPLLYGPMYTFMCQYPSYQTSARAITRALNKRGIKTYAPAIINETIVFMVSMKQARYANFLLEQWGVPVENPPAPKKKPRRKTKKSPIVHRCGYCNTPYKQFRSKCKQCGAPM